MDLDNSINKELREYVRERMKKDSLSFYDAIEEYLADAAEISWNIKEPSSQQLLLR